MLEIDGVAFDVPVLGVKRTADFLDKYAERTEDGNLSRELIGVYFNYQMEIGTALDTTAYGRLWDKLTEPVEFHTVTVPGSGGAYTFTAYFSGVGDELLLQKDGAYYFDNCKVNFIAKAPARS